MVSAWEKLPWDIRGFRLHRCVVLLWEVQKTKTYSNLHVSIATWICSFVFSSSIMWMEWTTTGHIHHQFHQLKLNTWTTLTTARDLLMEHAGSIGGSLQIGNIEKLLWKRTGFNIRDLQPIINKWKWFVNVVGKPMNLGSSWDERVRRPELKGNIVSADCLNASHCCGPKFNPGYFKSDFYCQTMSNPCKLNILSNPCKFWVNTIIHTWSCLTGVAWC